MTTLAAGGIGFFGSCFVLDWLRAGYESVMNLNAQFCAGNRCSLDSLEGVACKLAREPGWRPAKVHPNEHIRCTATASSSSEGQVPDCTRPPWSSASKSAGL